MKKIIGAALAAGLALSLAACDWGKAKPAEPPVGNEQGIGNEDALGGNAAIENGLDDNATSVDQAGPAANAVTDNAM